jgi:glycosyltransferase involved in cell wall biosynthesis
MITYGHQDYIEQAIEGILMQDYKGVIEVIIANDKSPDATNEIIRKIIHKHLNGSWIRYKSHESNMGPIKNFRWALQQATSKYIALCEGDDY